MSLSPAISASPFSQELKFDRFLIENGLSQSTIIDIAEDEQGFIWLATEEGLNRFDGNEFKHYKKNKVNERSLSDNLVRTLLVDNKNTLWVGTSHGLNKYNRNSDDFERFFHSEGDSSTLTDDEIWDIYQDNKTKPIS